MGQQQLLLVILVTIIVGIATVVAINTFSSASESANQDAVRNDMATIAASAQGYFIKPAMLGGGANSFAAITFANITFAADSISGDGLTAYNANGTYVISGRSATDFDLNATTSSNPDIEFTATVTQDNMSVPTLVP